MCRKEVPGVLGVELAPGLEECTTPYAGVSLLIELMRRCGVDAASNRVLAAKRGYPSGQMAECFVVLSALGGECLEDFAILRQDLGLEALSGYRPAAVETARQYLDRFHDEKLLEGRPKQGAFVPMEPSGTSGAGGGERPGDPELRGGHGAGEGGDAGRGCPPDPDDQARGFCLLRGVSGLPAARGGLGGDGAGAGR